MNSSRQLKRLYSISKSPIFSHFTETTNGVSVIRAYGYKTFISIPFRFRKGCTLKGALLRYQLRGLINDLYHRQEQRFIQDSQNRVSENVRSVYMNLMSNRWLGLRIETIGNIVVFFAALFAVSYKESLSGGQAGLSITSALQIVG